jgi:hypothetical protein
MVQRQTIRRHNYPTRITLRVKTRPPSINGYRPVCILRYRTGQRKVLFYNSARVLSSFWMEYQGNLVSKSPVQEISNSEANVIRLACSIREGMCKVIAGALPAVLVKSLKEATCSAKTKKNSRKAI